MKKIRKIFLVLLLFISFITLTGCTKSKPITAEQFKERMKEKSFTVYDGTDQFDSNDLLKVYAARTIDDSYQIEFFEFKTEAASIDAYKLNKNIFESSLGNVVNGKLVLDLKNVQKYRATSNGYYMVLTRIGKTMLFAKVPSEYTKTVSNIVTELGY